MNIYKLSRFARTLYDEVDSFVILAESVDMARRIAADDAGDEGAYTWVDDKVSACELIGEGSVRFSLIVCRSFKAG